MVQDTTVEGGCVAASFPLSPLQQGMVYHRVEASAPGVDVEQVVCELRHTVYAPEFEHAWRVMVRRHDCLRTGFHAGAGEPCQVVAAPDEVDLPVRVLDFGHPADAERALEFYLAEDRRLGFASLAAPLARVALFRGGDERAWFVFTYHHLVLDARGMYTLFKEVLEAHDSFARGEDITFPPTRPYRDYVSWLQTLDLRRAENYWREQLRGFAAPTPLPLVAPAEPPARDDDAPGELAWQLSRAETAQLRAAAERHGVTLNTLLQGAWAVVLSRYSGEDDVVFGAVRACRHVPVEGAGSMVGMLINTVPVRVRLASAASVDHWLRDLREQWVALRDYEQTPLLRVQQWSEIAPGRRLFETLFNFQEPSWIGALESLGGIWSERRFDIRSQPNYPLALDIYGDAELRVRAFYDRRRFAADSVARLLGHFRIAIRSLAAARVDTLGSISVLDEAERRRVLGEWNATDCDYPRDTCVHAAFEARCHEAPERLAAADGQASLTYGEMERRANQLAHRLRALGVGPDVPVVVAMNRSVGMLVAWLGVLKAGGAFVPLDPAYPAERQAFQLRDCGARVVLAEPSRAAGLALPEGITCLPVAADGGGFEAEPAEAPSPVSHARNLAYIIYTSGSTGQPKGVQVEHRSLLNLVTWHQRTYAITPADRAPQLASPAFDASVWEVWPYLTAGASVHVPDEETRISPARLWRWLSQQQITVAFLPTPLAEAALAELWPDGMALRALLTGGDRLRRPAPLGFPCALVNHYGPTENTVVATAAAVAVGAEGAPPIGRPIANTTAYVLDHELRPVPIGVPGELYLGGESLARGYLNRPELNAQKFVPNPFASLNSQPSTFNAAAQPRIYRTGDLVRWLPDGQLEFLGRRDNQVKIRGCRIEPAEIEAALQRHAEVREAVVLARTGERGQAQLVGFVVRTPEATSGERELLDFLRASLPAYMVPAAILVLEAWPLTPNGKIDRAALPAPRAETGAEGYEAPQGPREQTIAEVWGDILGRTRIGRHDHFFELGGHSLLAAQAVTRMNAALGAAISVRMLFDHPTVAELARELEARGAGVTTRPPLRPKRRAASPELELVPPR